MSLIEDIYKKKYQKTFQEKLNEIFWKLNAFSQKVLWRFGFSHCQKQFTFFPHKIKFFVISFILMILVLISIFQFKTTTQEENFYFPIFSINKEKLSNQSHSAINKDSIANYRAEEKKIKNQSKLQKFLNLKNSHQFEVENSKNTFLNDNLNKKIEDIFSKLPPADTDAKRNFAHVINQIDQINLELRKALSKLKDDSSFDLLFESYEKDFQDIGTYFNTPTRELDTYLEASYKNLKHSDNLITRLHLLTLAKYACPNVDTTPYLLEELENYKIRNSNSLTTDEERTEASLQKNLLARLLAQNYRLTWDQKNSLRSEYLEEN